MLVDAFLYNGEADMAALRMATLGPHVDLMVAVVCDLTHQSDPNPIPDAPCDQVVINAAPIPDGRGGHGTPWYQWIERQHRNGIGTLVDLLGLTGADVVMVSDVDEIPDPAALPDLAGIEAPAAVPMRMHGFALDYLYPLEWRGTTVSRADQLAPQAHRDWRYRLPGKGKGWHLSWLGDLTERQRKLRSFSHAELADLDVDACWRNGVHANGEQLTRCDVDDLDWPGPLFDGFPIPPSWRSPED